RPRNMTIDSPPFRIEFPMGKTKEHGGGEHKVRPRNNTFDIARPNECGVVLVALLWIFIALSAIALSFARESRVETAAVRNSQSMEKAYYIARAGISETVYRLAHQRFSSPARPPGLQQEPTPLELGRVEGEFGGGRFAVELEDESGKLNLNSDLLSEQQLRALVHATGIPPEDADTITDSIMDWRDPDNAHRMNGAEEEFYLTLDPSYAAKNGPVDTIEEILLVRGVTPEYYYGRPEKTGDGSIVYKYGLSRYVTVYSNRNQINVNFAPLPVLLSIPGMRPEDAERILERRLTRPYQNPREISDEIPGALGAQTLQYLATQASGIYSMRATGYEGNSKVRRVIRAVISLDGNQQNFHRILYWNESVPYYEGATL
ncbi:MAG: general secretion pathway protein GspK, partial [Acidobacteria bacterium]|nr:general secretion pathway protein GspK [Acidobacteriota bacterium]